MYQMCFYLVFNVIFLFFFRNQRYIEVHNLGSSLDTDVLYKTVINITKNISNKKGHEVYFALSGPLIKEFELFDNLSSFTYTKTKFFPHVSMESLHLYVTSIIDLLSYEENRSYFGSLTELFDIFSLVLFKITTKTV